MRLWKALFALVLVLLVASNVIWVYRYLDLAVTLTYREADCHDLDRSRALLGTLVVRGAETFSRADILHRLRQAAPEAFIVEADNAILVESTRFVFEEDRLVSVE